MTDATCPRCHLASDAPHDDANACIAALGTALLAMRSLLDELSADLDARRAHAERERELHAQAEADLARGG